METEKDRIITAVALWCAVKAGEGYNVVQLGTKRLPAIGTLNETISYREVGQKVFDLMWKTDDKAGEDDLLICLVDKLPYPQKQVGLIRSRVKAIMKLDRGFKNDKADF